jgi:hypothetical protein
VPGFPADDLSGVQTGALLGELVIFFDGLTRKLGPGGRAAANLGLSGGKA